MRRSQALLLALVVLLMGCDTTIKSGPFTEYLLPEGGYAAGIARGPDGNLWFTEPVSGKIGRITPGGALTEFALAPTSCPALIALGPDHSLWFAEHDQNAIGRITSDGKVTTFALPSFYSGPESITTGPDGALWFTEEDGNRIGRITPAGDADLQPLLWLPDSPSARRQQYTPVGNQDSRCSRAH